MTNELLLFIIVIFNHNSHNNGLFLPLLVHLLNLFKFHTTRHCNPVVHALHTRRGIGIEDFRWSAEFDIVSGDDVETLVKYTGLLFQVSFLLENLIVMIGLGEVL